MTSVTIFDKLPPSSLHLDRRAMAISFFSFGATGDNLEQIASLVDSGKLESGL